MHYNSTKAYFYRQIKIVHITPFLMELNVVNYTKAQKHLYFLYNYTK